MLPHDGKELNAVGLEAMQAGIPVVNLDRVFPDALASRLDRHLADAEVGVELDTGDMILNLGPQHPATHGTLRLVVRLDGERVVSADPLIGYMHRGYEKLTEFRTYPQITTLINRIDWLSSFANEVPFVDAAEQLMGIEAPRTRSTSAPSSPSSAASRRSCCSSARWACRSARSRPRSTASATASTSSTSSRRDRRSLPPQLQPHRRHQGRPAVGLGQRARRVMKMVFDACDTFEDLVAGNEIFEARTRSIGIIPAELGAAYGVSGSNLRASGVDWDLRRDGKPYLVYPELDFKVWTHPDGDSFARYWVRLQETRESCRMVLQMLDQMPAGPIMAKVPRIIKVPDGEAWVETENPLGQMGYYVVSKGATGPFRVKIRSASFSNVSILPWLLRGVFVPDVITILASLYFILGDIDR